MKSQVEVSELAEHIRGESRRHRELASQRQAAEAATEAARPPDEPLLPPVPELSEAVPCHSLPPVGNMIERARQKAATGSGAPGFLRPFFRNQGGYNGIVIAVMENLYASNQQLEADNRRLHDHLHHQSRWMQAAVQGIGRLEHRLAALERQNDFDQTWFKNLQAHGEYLTGEVSELRQRQRDPRQEIILAAVQDRVQALKGRFDDAQAEFEELKAHSSGRFGEAQAQIEELKAHSSGRFGEAQARIEELKAQHEAQSQHIQEVQDRLGHLSEHAEQRAKRGDEIQQQVHHVNRLADEVQSHADRLGTHLRNLQSQADEQGAHTVQVHQHLDELGQHVHRVNLQTDAVQSHADRLGVHLGNLQAQADEQGEHTAQVHRHLDELGQHVDGVHQLSDQVQGHADRLGEHLKNLQAQADEQGGAAGALNQRLGELPAWRAEIGQLVGGVAARQDAAEQSARRLDERMLADTSFLKHQLWLQQRKLNAPEEGTQEVEHDGGETKTQSGVGKDDLDALYVAFEDVFRGSRHDIKTRLEIYLPHLRGVQAGTADRPVLDLGCGRGEWLELLGENGLAASGIDLNTCMIKQCHDRGLPATEADALDHLIALPDGSVGAITAFHLIEHLPFAVLMRFFRECRRVLQPGGVAIYETPNPYNIIVGAAQFYDDHTHQRPRPPNSTRFLVEQAGFARVEILPLHPREDADKVHGDGSNESLVARFNELFYGPQDYALIATATA